MKQTSLSSTIFLCLGSLQIVSSLSSSANFCYYGFDVNTLGALQNQTCSTGELHLANVLKVTDYQSSLRQNTSTTPSAQLSMSDQIQRYCFVFRHISKEKLSSGLEQEKVRIEYGCDYKGACEGKVQERVLNNVTIDDKIGKLYCCTSDNCNTDERIPHPPAENRLCYTGPYTRNGVKYGKETSCSHPDTVCAKKSLYQEDGTLISEKFFCDNSKICSEQLSMGAYRACSRNVTKNNVTEELCCCEVKNCFIPSWPLLNGNKSSLISAQYISKPISNPFHKSKENNQNNLLVAGLVGTLIFVVTIGVGVVVIVACRKREKHRDPNVIMQYERLNSEADYKDPVVL